MDPIEETNHIENKEIVNTEENTDIKTEESSPAEESSKGNELTVEQLTQLKDSIQLMSLMKQKKEGNKINYYHGLPEEFKPYVDNLVDFARSQGDSSMSANSVTKMVLDEMIQEYEQNKNEETVDLDQLIDEFKQYRSELGNVFNTIDEERKADLQAGIERCEAENKHEQAKALRDVLETIDKAYYLNEFAEFCLKCKIKRFDLQKPKKHFERFNYKYSNNKYKIGDINQAVSILANHFKSYEPTHTMMLCLAFCKYCQNMDPNDMKDHTFMYYFLRNIACLDIFNYKGNFTENLNEKNKKFYVEFKENLSKCIDNLLIRNPNLQ